MLLQNACDFLSLHFTRTWSINQSIFPARSTEEVSPNQQPTIAINNELPRPGFPVGIPSVYF